MATTVPAAAFNANPVQSNPLQSVAGVSIPELPGNVFGTGNTQLQLANGMTAGIGLGVDNYSNPALPMMSQTGAAVNPYGGDPRWPIQRIGVMRNLPGSLGGTPDGTGGSDVSYLYFIYNPNQIQASFSTNTGSIPPMYLYGAGSSNSGVQADSASTIQQLQQQGSSLTTVPNLTSTQQVSWSLVFDRTYDMMYDTNPDLNRGVLKDTAALYSLMGTFESSGAVPVATPIQVVFGQTSSGQLWGFTGYVASVGITYGIFRHNMIPSRCEVDLTMMCTYVAATVPASGAGTASVTPNGAPSVNGPPPQAGLGGSVRP